VILKPRYVSAIPEIFGESTRDKIYSVDTEVILVAMGDRTDAHVTAPLLTGRGGRKCQPDSLHLRQFTFKMIFPGLSLCSFRNGRYQYREVFLL
jgi:hypothetical protein